MMSAAPCRAPPPDSARKTADLRITVPDSDLDSLSGLADAIVMQPPSLASLVTSFEFEKITQLPTPVLHNGQFSNYQIGIQKRATKNTAGAQPSPSNFPLPSRVVSEFDLSRLSGPPNDFSQAVPKSRHILNPSLLPKQPASEIPLPPLDAALDFSGLAFIAPHLEMSYAFDQVIGAGAFSTVVSARAEENSSSAIESVVAVKIVTVPTDDVASVSNFRLYICRELGILKNLHHPGIVQLLDYNLTLSILDVEIDESFAGASLATPPGADMYDLYNMKLSNKQYFFLSYCRGGNLFEWLLRNHNLASTSATFWKLMERIVAELVAAVAFLHSNMVVHRDIKLENILLQEAMDLSKLEGDGFLKTSLPASLSVLTDFGLSKKLELPTQLLLTKCGSQDYVSPELLMGLKYDGKLLDSWSLGVVIYLILEDRLPFDMPPQDLVNTLGVSPSVIKRRRSRHNPAHRIAMIDWDWYRIPNVLKDESFPEAAKDIVQRLMTLVEALLVRKDKRMLAVLVLDDVRFGWIKNAIPRELYDFPR